MNKPLPLRPHSASLLVPWVIGAATALVLIVSFITSFYGAFVQERQSLAGPSITVELTAVDGARPGLVKRAASLMRLVPDVKRVQVVSWSHMKNVLDPLLGEQSDQLPYPSLVHVWSDVAPEKLVPQLRDRLDNLRASPHFMLYKSLPKSLTIIQNMGGVLLETVLLLCFASFFVLFGMCIWTYLRIHRPVLELLVVMGGFPGYLRRQLLHNLWRMLVKATLVMASFFLVFFWGVFLFLEAWGLSGLVLSRLLWKAFAVLGGAMFVGAVALTFGLVFWMVAQTTKNAGHLFK